MADRSRSLPDRPSLRYLKLEARRRVSSGEFQALHAAQLAIAREHGQPSWGALKHLIDSRAQPESHALAQLRWLLARFADASGPSWQTPDRDELDEHFAQQLLRQVGPQRLVTIITAAGVDLGETLTVTRQTPLEAEVQLGDMLIIAAVEPTPPHRLTILRRVVLASRINDARLAAPISHLDGEVPHGIEAIADDAHAQLGLVGLTLAGGRPGGSPWALTRGWASLETGRPLTPRDRFPAYGITHPVTATGVMRLVAAGRVALDQPANQHLRTVRLADDSVTIRELLLHTGGVDHPTHTLAPQVPELVDHTGPVLACSGQRGTFHYSNEGFGALGQLIADLTGFPYSTAITELVLAPLGMNGSSFPTRRPTEQPGTVTGYDIARDGTLTPTPPLICTIAPAGGLWTTPADLIRFALGWTRLLPDALAREALTPQAPASPTGGQRGLGWIIHHSGELYGSAGTAPDASTSLLIATHDSRAQVALTNRRTPIEPLNIRALRTTARRRDDLRTRRP